MSNKTSMYREILREYDRLRQRKEREKRARVEDIYERIPKLRRIEEGIAQGGISVAKAILQEPQKREVYLAELMEKITGLRKEREVLLKEVGIEPKELEVQYDCLECKDTGFIESTKCACMKQKLMDLGYAQSNLRERLVAENFDTFDLRYYSQEINEKEKNSPRANMEKIFKWCVNFADDFGKQFNNLLFYGSTGLGKTFLCNCIAGELLKKGKTVLYLTAAELFKTIEEERFHKNEEEEPKDYIADILDVDLFIIDDLGSEFSTILSSSELFHIINSRMLARKPVIISTNLSMGDLIDQYSDRVVSRLIGEYRNCKFFGGDIRMMKKMRRKADD